MVIVADTSPVNYLVLIDQIGILPRLYSRVLIPPAVFDELTHPAAVSLVCEWTERHPVWLEVMSRKTPSRLRNSTTEKARRLRSPANRDLA
jgi:predicted nucleic acid-binding protein